MRNFTTSHSTKFLVASLFLIALFIPGINQILLEVINRLLPYGDLLSAAATLFVGSFAFGLYLKQRSDNKKEVATTILIEIENAQRALKEVKKKFPIGSKAAPPADIFVMPQDSWNKNKHLFVKDFERDEWDAISSFYFCCLKYDEAVAYNNSLFSKNEDQARVNIIRIAADHYYKIKTKSKKLSEEEQNQMRNYFENDLVSQLGQVWYLPRKPLITAHKFVDEIDTDLTLSKIGIKLRHLTGTKN